MSETKKKKVNASVLMIASLIFSVALGLFVRQFIVNGGDFSEVSHPFEGHPYVVARPVDLDERELRELVDELEKFDDSGRGGLAFIAWPGHGVGTTYLAAEEAYEAGLLSYTGRMFLESPQDVITVNVLNFSLQPEEFVIKLFYNYEAVAFRIVGEAHYQTTFFVELGGLYEINLPIQLDSTLTVSEYLSKLTVAAFLAPHEFVADDPFLDNISIVMNFDIDYGSNSDVAVLDVDFQEPELRNETLTCAICFSLESYPNINLPSTLEVHAGEVITLTYVIGDVSDQTINAHSFAVIGMINWEQISLNNQPYLLVLGVDDILDRSSHYGQVSFQVPDEVGYHEFAMFLVVNPLENNGRYPYWSELGPLHRFFPLSSHRFTIHVIE